LPADDRSWEQTGRAGGRPFLPPVPDGQGADTHGFDRPADGQRGVVDEDSEPTSPLPVILPGAASIPRPAEVEEPRGFFEPARTPRPTSITGSVEPPSAPPVSSPARDDAALAAGPQETGPAASWGIPEEASAKLEQIKDLYLTAEAIGEDALDKHFDQVSQRQRELIRDFFDRSRPDGEDAS
jgi:hypothetical protein